MPGATPPSHSGCCDRARQADGGTASAGAPSPNRPVGIARGRNCRIRFPDTYPGLRPDSAAEVCTSAIPRDLDARPQRIERPSRNRPASSALIVDQSGVATPGFPLSVTQLTGSGTARPQWRGTGGAAGWTPSLRRRRPIIKYIYNMEFRYIWGSLPELRRWRRMSIPPASRGSGFRIAPGSRRRGLPGRAAETRHRRPGPAHSTA